MIMPSFCRIPKKTTDCPRAGCSGGGTGGCCGLRVPYCEKRAQNDIIARKPWRHFAACRAAARGGPLWPARRRALLPVESRTAPATMEYDTADKKRIEKLETMIISLREVRVHSPWRVPSRCGARGAHRMRANVSARSGDKGQGTAKRVRRHRKVAPRSP
jgi:hypothetical protein